MRKLITALLLAISAVVVFATPAAATDKSVHHPEDSCQGTFIKDQPPFDGLSVTAAYSGTMWLKISTQHVEVPVVTAGETYGPGDLSSWPTNKKGKPQAISHVDYCVVETPPTTEPPVTTVPETPTTTLPEPPDTTPETTEPPEVTVPPTSEPECVPSGSEITDVATGETYIYGVPTQIGFDTCGNPIPDICVDWGDHFSTLWTLRRCEPPVATTPPSPETTVAAPSSQLPATGSGTTALVLAGLALLGLGGGALVASRRRVS